MSKKSELLGKEEATFYDLNEQEILEVASLVALVEQARAAQDFIFTRIVENIADRYEIVGKDISLNFDEIMQEGAKVARLVVRD